MQPYDITPDANHAGVDRLSGFSIEEDSGSAAVIQLRKATVSGQVIVYLRLAAGQSANIQYPDPIAAEGGVFVKEVSGSVTGVLYGP